MLSNRFFSYRHIFQHYYFLISSKRSLSSSSIHFKETDSKRFLSSSSIHFKETDSKRFLSSSFIHFKETDFGFKRVDENAKASLVSHVFSSVANSYDTMNDAMSFGIHRLWKDEFVKRLNPKGPLNVLDVAGGTGDITLRILEYARIHSNTHHNITITCSDINPDMLKVGKNRFKKLLKYSKKENLHFIELDAENLLSIPSNSLDLYTIAFGIRNTTNIGKVLNEAYRVLKPGGIFSCLEFGKISHPENKNTSKNSIIDIIPFGRQVLSRLYEIYSFSIIPQMGQIIAADRDSYQYLVESIVRFPSQEKFAQMIKDAGFTIRGNGYTDLTFGVAAIHTGIKL